MTTEARLKDAAEFLAKELMGWKWCEIGKGYVFEDNPVSMYPHWQDSEGKFLCYPEKFNWTPYADTPEGLFQCLGKGGVVEKMREKDWMLKFNVYQLLYEAYFYNPKTKESTWPMTDNFALGAAIVFAAATALGWKEE